MRVALNHLLDNLQTELTRVRDILTAGFVRAISTSAQPRKENGDPPKLILFGSYSLDVGQTSYEFGGLNLNRAGG